MGGVGGLILTLLTVRGKERDGASLYSLHLTVSSSLLYICPSSPVYPVLPCPVSVPVVRGTAVGSVITVTAFHSFISLSSLVILVILDSDDSIHSFLTATPADHASFLTRYSRHSPLLLGLDLSSLRVQGQCGDTTGLACCAECVRLLTGGGFVTPCDGHVVEPVRTGHHPDLFRLSHEAADFSWSIVINYHTEPFCTILLFSVFILVLLCCSLKEVNQAII